MKKCHIPKDKNCKIAKQRIIGVFLYPDEDILEVVKVEKRNHDTASTIVFWRERY